MWSRNLLASNPHQTTPGRPGLPPLRLGSALPKTPEITAAPSPVTLTAAEEDLVRQSVQSHVRSTDLAAVGHARAVLFGPMFAAKYRTHFAVVCGYAVGAWSADGDLSKMSTMRYIGVLERDKTGTRSRFATVAAGSSAQMQIRVAQVCKSQGVPDLPPGGTHVQLKAAPPLELPKGPTPTAPKGSLI